MASRRMTGASRIKDPKKYLVYGIKSQKEAFLMKVWVCTVCGWIYDEAKGDPDYDLAPGVPFEDLPDDFVCPLCGVGKDMFEEQQS